MLIEAVVSVLPSGSVAPASIAQRQPPAPGPDRSAGAGPRPVSDFTALARQGHETGRVRRRYGHYSFELRGTLVLLAAIPYTTTTTFLPSCGPVVRHLNTVGLKGDGPFLCPLVASRRALPTTATRP